MQDSTRRPRAGVPDRLFARSEVLGSSAHLMFEHRARFGRRVANRVPVEVIDAAYGGVLVRLPAGTGLQPGMRVGVELAGSDALGEVRHVAERAAGEWECGVQFLRFTDAMRAVIDQIVAERDSAARLDGVGDTGT